MTTSAMVPPRIRGKIPTGNLAQGERMSKEMLFASQNLTAGELNALVKKVGGEEMVRKIFSYHLEIIVLDKIPGEFVTFIDDVKIMARTTEFVVRDEFSVGNHGGLKIAHCSGSFNQCFGRKVEKPAAETELTVLEKRLSQRNCQSKFIREIIAKKNLAFGENSEISLAEFHALLMKQGNGQDGPLFTDGRANVAYIRNFSGVLCVVIGLWHVEKGWELQECSIGELCIWSDGS